ncbi:MAG TPA: DUF1501 domain-containing protein [Bdellovibrionales bacterium]|nr:DUF1501 domain-containing protein [Bdellovibrionales bacterium]
MKNTISRRQFIQFAGAGTLTYFLPGLPGLRAQNAATNDHFFLQLFVPGGFDSSLLFDARPLAMTQAGLIHNYPGKEPVKWEGTNGQWTWASPFAEPLNALKNELSICNGLLMAPSFDGHDQNTNYYLSGNPFGGDCFLPHLNEYGTKLPIDAALNQMLFATIDNGGNMVPMDYYTLQTLIEKLKADAPLDMNDPLWQFISGRYKENAELAPAGMFSRGSAMMMRSLPTAAALESIVKQIKLGSTTGDSTAFLYVVGELFKARIARTAIFSPSFQQQVDCHDVNSAKNHHLVAGALVDYIVKTVAFLKATPFDGTRSLYDVTTVSITSEFSRTMRQAGRKIDDTGTDHNNLTNTIILCGKGIKGGLVLGESDFRVVGEQLSGAHKKRDLQTVKSMGKPFDFSTFKPRADLPEEYDYRNYLHVHSVVNTLYELFGVPKTKWRAPERDAPPSPVLKPLLA